jgi:hypothetical protein
LLLEKRVRKFVLESVVVAKIIANIFMMRGLVKKSVILLLFCLISRFRLKISEITRILSNFSVFDEVYHKSWKCYTNIRTKKKTVEADLSSKTKIFWQHLQKKSFNSSLPLPLKSGNNVLQELLTIMAM